MDSHCWTVRHDRERVHALSGSSVCEARSCTRDAGTQDPLFRSRLDRLRQRNLDALDRNPCVMRRIPELATLIRLRGGVDRPFLYVSTTNPNRRHSYRRVLSAPRRTASLPSPRSHDQRRRTRPIPRKTSQSPKRRPTVQLTPPSAYTNAN